MVVVSADMENASDSAHVREVVGAKDDVILVQLLTNAPISGLRKGT